MKSTIGAQHINPKLISDLASFDTPTIANCMESLEIRNPSYLGPEIRAVTSILKPIVGLSVTATFSEQRGGRYEHLEAWLSFLESIAQVRLPVVAVMHDASRIPGREAMIGEGMASAMRASGAVGAICDGANRDIKALREMRFPVFCNGLVVDRGRIRFHQYQVPVQLGSMKISPGDLIHADENGAIVIPSERVAEILQAAARVVDHEASFFKLFSEPNYTPAKLRQYYQKALESARSERDPTGEQG